MRPYSPLEQATAVKERDGSSYVVSYERVSTVVCAKAGRTNARAATARDANFMVVDKKADVERSSERWVCVLRGCRSYYGRTSIYTLESSLPKVNPGFGPTAKWSADGWLTGQDGEAGPLSGKCGRTDDGKLSVKRVPAENV